MQTIKTFGVIGTGIIGAGWAARALARGLNVLAFDPGADAQHRLRDNLAQVWPVLQRTGLFPGASADRLRFCDSLEEVALGAQFIQESAPERIELKTTLHAQIDAAAPADVLIASSTSGWHEWYHTLSGQTTAMGPASHTCRQSALVRWMVPSRPTRPSSFSRRLR